MAKTSNKSKKTLRTKSKRTRTSALLPGKYAAKPWKVLTILFIILGLGGALFFWLQSRAAGNATLLLTPASAEAVINNTVSFQVRVNSGQDQVNVVQANLSYPTDKLEFAGISTAGTGFPNKVQESGGNGSVKIGRYTDPNESTAGDLLLATVTFKALASSGTAQVSFASGSMIVRSPDTADILGSTNVATITLKSSGTTTPPPPPPPPAPVPVTTPRPTSPSPSPTPTPTPTPEQLVEAPAPDDSDDQNVTAITLPDPTNAVATPTQASRVTGLLRVASDVATGSAKRVELLLNGRIRATDSKAPFAAEVDTTTIKNGSYTVSLRTVNADGTATTTSQEIVIANNLNAFERFRNLIFAPWAGISGRIFNTIMLTTFLLVIGLPLGAIYILRRFNPVVL